MEVEYGVSLDMRGYPIRGRNSYGGFPECGKPPIIEVARILSLGKKQHTNGADIAPVAKYYERVYRESGRIRRNRSPRS